MSVVKEWNPSIKATIGEGNFGLYREVSLSQGYIDLY